MKQNLRCQYLYPFLLRTLEVVKISPLDKNANICSEENLLY